MNIQLSPYRPAEDTPALTLARSGDTLTINGVDHDIAALAALEPEFEGEPVAYPDPILDISGAAPVVTVRFPIGADAPEAARFPALITDPPDGPIPLPPVTAE